MRPSGRNATTIRKLGLAALGAALFLALLWGSYHSARQIFLGETAARGRTVLDLQAENIEGWLDRYRALPRIYAESTAVRSLLQEPNDSALLHRVNHRLALWNIASGAADTYLLDRGGTAIAASNWADPITFVGKNYTYRPYYSEAMQGRQGRFFALGTASGRRGYYFSYPVVREGRILGVVVVKVGVDSLEAELAASPYQLFVTDPNEIVVLAGNPDWRLTLLAPLDEAAKADITANRQFDLAALDDPGLPFAGQVPDAGRQLRIEEGEVAGRYLQLTRPLPSEAWTLHLLLPTRLASAQAFNVVLALGFGLLALGLVIALLWQRRRRLVERLKAREEAQATLARTVAERTADLRHANLLLEEEVHERKAAEDDLRRAQNDLVQAAKLAALGQMSAAMSHEFNQPVTAIRTFADNAAAFLARGQEERAKGNLEQIVRLTDRIAELSRHLRSFARRPQGSIRAISLSAVVSESLALLSGQMNKAGVALDLRLADDPLWVQGGHVRLQQVVVNLLTNALDAVRDGAQPCVALSVVQRDDRVILTVEDNGEGIKAEDLGQIFDPFFTTKEVGKGLGLGLSISYNIVRDFGGRLEAVAGRDGGACFTVTLQAAEAPLEVPTEKALEVGGA